MVIDFKTIKEALSQPVSRHFRISCTDGKLSSGNAQSFYNESLSDENLTFDISNNKALVNVSLNGSIKNITFFRGSYYADSIPGVWTNKDISATGPYSFSIKIEDAVFDLSSSQNPRQSWPFMTSLLDNIFPVTYFFRQDIKVVLTAFAPISADGSKRPRGVIYGVMLENISSGRLKGSVILPVAGVDRVFDFARERDIDIGLADYIEKSAEVAFDLLPGQYVWVPAVLSAPGENTVEEIDVFGTLYWLNSTWTYFKSVIGQFKMPDDEFTSEFFQRQLCQCIECIGADRFGNISGSSWGTYPSVREIWMKDMYYAFLPLVMFEPNLFRKGIMWFFEYSIRPKSKTYEGGVSHSLGNSLAPVMMAGLYYAFTGDRDFFICNPYIRTKIAEILSKVEESRRDKDVWLFPSIYISDGLSNGDYHTGSNICAWFAFKSSARIFDEVYGDSAAAAEYNMISESIQKDIEAHNVVEGSLGKRYTEGVSSDGTVPFEGHDGEESDTTLIPFYGYAQYDNNIYKNYTRYSMSRENPTYREETRGLAWGVDATFTGYVTGIANIADYESMNGENGFLTEIRRLTDMDGSVWWWVYPVGNKRGEVVRLHDSMTHYPGKCAWASGVFVCLFVSEILGIKYDAPTRTLNFRPFSPSSGFAWEGFRIGGGNFSCAYSKGLNGIAITVANNNSHSIALDLEVIVDKGKEVKKILKNNKEVDILFENGMFLNKPTIRLSQSLLPHESINLSFLF